MVQFSHQLIVLSVVCCAVRFELNHRIKETHASLYLPGDTVHLSDIDMIAGTPVLDIKPYIPQYDCPDARMSMDTEPYGSNTDQPNPMDVSLNEENPHEGSDSQLNSECNCDDMQNFHSEDKSKTDVPLAVSSTVSTQFSLPKEVHNVLQDVKSYVSQDEDYQLRCENKERDSPKANPPALTLEQPCFGEEAYTTIAGWIREPPVASLEVRFTPRAEKELAEFLPTHLAGK